MIKMAATPIYNKNKKKSFCLQNQLGDDREKLVCSIVYESDT